MLEGAAREYVECGDGTEALARFESERPDCVLMDLEMKGMDGMETMRRLLSRHPRARIFILSQHDDPDLRATAIAAGAAGFFAKDDLPALRGLLSGSLDL